MEEKIINKKQIMEKIVAKKEQVNKPELKMKVFHEEIYKGRELMTVVGIREYEIELRGDFSGGTNNTISSSWFPIKGTFRLKKICNERLKFGSCPLPNVHCDYPGCEPYLSNWGHYVDGKLIDKVELR